MTAAAKNKKVTDLVRKVGDRQVEVDVDLTPEQIEEQHDTLVSLLEQIDEIEEKAKENKANFAAQTKAVELQKSATLRLIRSKCRRVNLEIQEWLTKSNEIVQIVTKPDGSQERIGDARRARADELQEKLFPDTPDKPDDEGDVEIPEAAPVADDFPASDDAFGPQVS
jgi:hypothetical protein